jgi:hypothetical protein
MKRIFLIIGFGLLTTDAFALTGPACLNLGWGQQPNYVTCSGNAPNLSTSGLAVSQHAEIVPIFWGNWTTGDRAQLVGQLQAMAGGAYFSALDQYRDSGTVGPVRVVPAAPIYGAPVPSPTCGNGSACGLDGTCANGPCNVQHDAIEDAVDTMIFYGTVPPPTKFTDMIYAVFLPNGSLQEDYNHASTCSLTCGLKYASLPYKIVVTDGGTTGLSHELVEAITDNVTITNCQHSGGGDANQIADICGCWEETQYTSAGSPLKLKAYWSKEKNECVIPEGFGGLWAHDSTGWSEVYSGTIRQAHAGGFGVVVTDSNDNLISLAGGTPTNLGHPGAMFAVGDDAVYRLTLDGGAVDKYTTASGWTPFFSGPTGSIYAGRKVLRTDLDGNPYVYGNGVWAQLDGGFRDQLAVNEDGVIALAADHGSVLINASGIPGGWQPIGGAGDELFVGSQSCIAETTLAATNDVLLNSGAGTGWQAQGFFGNDFACTQSGLLFGLDAGRNGAFYDGGGGGWSTWNVIGGIAAPARLVQKSDASGRLYATGPVVY